MHHSSYNGYHLFDHQVIYQYYVIDVPQVVFEHDDHAECVAYFDAVVAGDE